MRIPIPFIRPPEPRAIRAFIKAGHPWMAFVMGMVWLLSSVAIVALVMIVALHIRR